MNSQQHDNLFTPERRNNMKSVRTGINAWILMLILAAPAAAATLQQPGFTFTKIVDTASTTPLTVGVLAEVLPNESFVTFRSPSLVGGAIAFVASSTSRDGVYLYQENQASTLAHTFSPSPYSVFSALSMNIPGSLSFDGNTIVFQATPSTTNDRGLYQAAAGEPLTIVATRSSVTPPQGTSDFRLPTSAFRR